MSNEMSDEELGGVHLQYLYWCQRRLWLYAHGFKPEFLSDKVAMGKAVDRMTYVREHEIDLGQARIDWVKTGAWVHERKTGSVIHPADEAQVRHYCLLLSRLGVEVEGGEIHLPLIRRTKKILWNEETLALALEDEQKALDVINKTECPERISRKGCQGCAYKEYCYV